MPTQTEIDTADQDETVHEGVSLKDPANSAVPSGGASAASQSARAASSVAAAAPGARSCASVSSSSTSAHAAVSFLGDTATASLCPAMGGAITLAAHPLAGEK